MRIALKPSALIPPGFTVEGAAMSGAITTIAISSASTTSYCPASRVKLSTIDSTRILRPSNSWSDRKSIDQHSLGTVAYVRSSRSFAFTLRLGVSLRSWRPQLAVQAVGALIVDLPTFTPEQHMDASVPVANTGRSQVLDPHLQAGLIEAAGLVALGRSIDRKRAAGSPFPDLIARLQIADDLPSSTRPHIFRRMTSCSISLSRLRFATKRFSRTNPGGPAGL